MSTMTPRDFDEWARTTNRRLSAIERHRHPTTDGGGGSGEPGPPGPEGEGFLSGSGAPPAGFGAIGDSYLDVDTGDTYGPKTASGWGAPTGSLIGPEGDPGAPGPTGSTGPAGAAGPTGPTGPQGPASPPGLDSGWHYLGYANEPKLRAGITPYDLAGSLWAQPRYRRDGAGCTFLEGLLSPVAASTTPLFTLPVGFRPAYRQILSTDIGTSGVGQVEVWANGDVVLLSGPTGNYLSLNGITFMADDAQTIAWTNLTLINGWANFDTATYGPAGHFIDAAGDVHLRGVVRSGTGIVAMLPVGAHQSDFPQMYQATAAAGGNSGLARVDTKTDGGIEVVGYTGGGTNAWVSLNGIVITNPTGTWPIALPLTNGWSSLGQGWPPNASMRVNRYGVASLRGLIVGGAIGNVANNWTIPQALSPTLNNVYLTCAWNNAGARIDVTKEGAVALSGYQNGGGNGWVSLNQRWFVHEDTGSGGGGTAGPQGPAGPAGQDEITVAHQPAPTTSGLELWVDLDTDVPAAGTGIPPGGLAGQVLSKDTNVDYAAAWKYPVPFVQAGVVNTTTNAAGGYGINFPLPFAAPPVVVITDANSTASFTNAHGTIQGNVSTLAASCVARSLPSGNAVASTGIIVNWIAIGTRP